MFNRFSFQVALGKMVSLFSLILNRIEKQVLISSNFNIDPAEEIMVLGSIKEWQRWASQIFDSLRMHIQLGKRNNFV